MDFLPISLKVAGRPCLVVGGGEVAARKVALLRRAGARVTVVAPQIDAVLAEQEGVQCQRRAFAEKDLDGVVLVIAATDDMTLNRQVAELAEKRSLPVNVVDDPQRCSFTLPSIVDRSPVVVAVATGGASPVLARVLRSKLESYIPAAYGRLATLMAEYREKVKQRFGRVRERRRFWESVINGPVAGMVFNGRPGQAREVLDRCLREQDVSSLQRGEVFLVGAGPGDPDLLTFRALRLMQQADVVLYDRLVSPAVMDLVRREAQRIYVGKHRANHALRQEEINALLVKLARQGKRVLRLKGGDPFIFGRGGEEIDTLREHGIDFQVVPGITAASGCACYAGIPLTHRDFAQSVVFVTGQLKDGTVNLNWPALVQPAQTVVVYMGLAGLPVLTRQLQAHGAAPATPVAVIEQGTLPRQRVVTGTLNSIEQSVGEAQIKGPTTIIIGGVVTLRDKLAWM